MSLTVLLIAYPLAAVGPDSVGGSEQVLAALDRALVAAGHRSIVIACEGSVVEGELVSFPLRGRTGKITVNGVEYNGVMTPVAGLDDEKLAAVLTYVINAWGNSARPFTAEEVKTLRTALPPLPVPVAPKE